MSISSHKTHRICLMMFPHWISFKLPQLKAIFMAKIAQLSFNKSIMSWFENYTSIRSGSIPIKADCLLLSHLNATS